jgi:MFS family permease
LDRFDRRKVVLWTDLGLMAVAALLAVNAFAGSPQVWALYVLAACATSLWSLGAPALRAMMPGLVAEDQLAASQALQSIYSQTAAIAGPALGGLLIAAAGIGWAYAIDAATFSASLVAVLLVAPAPPRGEIAREAFESLREGWRRRSATSRGIVASLTSLRFSVVSGGIASAAGAVAILALLPGIFRYDGSGHGRGLTPTATEP